jgi:MerR family transcriptional regulator, redox-sensitive transcriptional activator SoxR
MVGSAGLSIGEVARQAGVRASALRYYESVGLLLPPQRVAGRRVYDAASLDALRVIHLAKDAGFTVAEIRRLFHGFDSATAASARWQSLATRKLHDITALIARARRMQQVLEGLLSCECTELEECVRPRDGDLIPLRRGHPAPER